MTRPETVLDIGGKCHARDCFDLNDTLRVLNYCRCERPLGQPALTPPKGTQHESEIIYDFPAACGCIHETNIAHSSIHVACSHDVRRCPAAERWPL